MKRNLLFACKLIIDHVRSRKIRPKLKPPISHSLLTSTNTSSPGASPSVCFIAASYLPSLPPSVLFSSVHVRHLRFSSSRLLSYRRSSSLSFVSVFSTFVFACSSYTAQQFHTNDVAVGCEKKNEKLFLSCVLVSLSLLVPRLLFGVAIYVQALEWREQ